MHKYVILNHELVLAKEAKIPAVSPAALYGQGVFTTLAIYNRRPFLWEEHCKRLTQSNNSELDEVSFLSSLSRLIEKNNVQTGRARITLFDGKGFGLWRLNEKDEKPYHLLIMTEDAHAHLNGEINVTSSAYPSSALSRSKENHSYINHLIEFQKYTYDSDYDEKINVDEKGWIVSGCMSNVFWIKNRELFTPTNSLPLIEGTTRNFIIKIAKECGINVRQVRRKLNTLKEADEMFLTSSGIGICLVKKFDSDKTIKIFAYTKKSLAWQLREAYKESTNKF